MVAPRAGWRPPRAPRTTGWQGGRQQALRAPRAGGRPPRAPRTSAGTLLQESLQESLQLRVSMSSPPRLMGGLSHCQSVEGLPIVQDLHPTTLHMAWVSDRTPVTTCCMIKFAACRVLYQPKTPNRKRCHLQDWEEGSLRDTVVEYLRPSTLHIVSMHKYYPARTGWDAAGVTATPCSDVVTSKTDGGS